MASYSERLLGAAMLDVRIYEEVEHDESALGQAMATVALSSIAAGIAGYGLRGLWGLLVGVPAALVGWFVWAFVIYIVGAKLVPDPQTKADLGQLLRTIGFAAAPGLLAVLGILPLFGIVVGIANLWQIVTTVVAVRQALDYESTWKAIFVCVVGWLGFSCVAALVLRATFFS